ncbi:MAG TPA: hypothetical protein DCZ71_02495 [Ruminococcus sp.]|nr:hypothetical protein [Ruminococcus sp.]
MNIAVCDDEKVFRQALTEKLEEYSSSRGIEVTVSEFGDGSELLASKDTYDMIFLDHQMNQTSGLDTIREIRSRGIGTRIVFVSSYSEIVFESMKYSAYRFLVKPVDREKLFEALDSAIKEDSSTRKVVVKDIEYGSSVVVPEKDIIYAQAENIYAIVITADSSYRYSNSISTLQSEVSEGLFFRSNRSYLINLDHVSSFTKSEIILSNGQKALLSKLKYKDFRNTYYNFLRNKRTG